MKYLRSLFLALLAVAGLSAQVTSSATESSGSGYQAITDGGFDLETPDCVHTGFGAHITQVFDEELDRNVFVFHGHVEEDNDRCQVFDRLRMEIKGGPGTIPELQHTPGEISYYRWKFRLDENYVGGSSFHHLYQNKAVGGSDAGFPVITLTARVDRVELRHNGGDTGSDLNNLVIADLDLFRGRWVECYLRQTHGENGELAFTARDMATGMMIMEYQNDDIDLWRAGANYNRPKWGTYRSKSGNLRDEEIRFADFCVSETSADLCPGELPPSSDATLASLTIGGTVIDTFRPDQTVYHFPVDGGGVPSVDFTRSSAPATAVLEQPVAVPGAAFVTVTAEDGVTQLTYSINYLEVVGTVDPELQAALSAYPIPATDRLTVKLPGRTEYTGRLFAADGRAVGEAFSLRDGQSLNVAGMPGGIYLLVVRAESGSLARLKVLVE